MKEKPKNKPEQKISPVPQAVPSYSFKKQVPYLLGILALTFICFLPVLKNELIVWDDQGYTTNNPYIREISLPALFRSFYMGCYHPLTMLSYSLEYKFFGINATVFHLDNLLLHLLNTALVFIFTFLLVKRQRQDRASDEARFRLMIVPTVTALLFAIHPMHVESVAWASERKDVLYVFFLLLSLIAYVFYLRGNCPVKYLLVAFLCYVLSLFSKGQAIVLPLLFLAIDYYLARKIDKRLILEKVPFFILSIVFGVVAIRAQQSVSAVNTTYLENGALIFTSAYGLVLYLIKAVVPIDLSGIHPYTGNQNTWMYVAPFVIVALAYLVYRSTKKNRFVLFGAMFFLCSIVTVLKFIPLGDAIFSERYSYLPYIGLFFIFGNYLAVLLARYGQYKTMLYTGFTVVTLILVIATYQRCLVWRDNVSFWTDVAEKYPDYWRGNTSLGDDCLKKKQYAGAVGYYTKAIESDKDCPYDAYLSRGNIYLENLKRNDLAIADLRKVIELPGKHIAASEEVGAEQNLGLAYFRSGQYDSAIKIYERVAKTDPGNGKTFQLLGLAYLGKKEYPLALDNYTTAINLNPPKDVLIEALINRGGLYADVLGRYDDALADFNRALTLSPGNADATLNTGVIYYKKGQYESALNIFNAALLKDQTNAQLFYIRALCLAGVKDYSKALHDINQAKSLGKAIDETLVKNWESELQH